LVTSNAAPAKDVPLHLRLIALSVALLLTVACGDQPQAEPEETAAGMDAPPEATAEPEAALGEGITVVTTVFPPTSMAQDIAPGADVRLLTSSGQDPHDLELSPADRALIETADVVIYMGDIDFQPQVEAAVGDAAGEVVSVAEVAGAGNLRDFEGHTHDEDDGGEDDGHGHADEADHGDDDGHDEEGAAVDPHIWFDAAIMAEVAEEIGEALAALDPDHAEGYREAAGAVHDDLVALDAELDELLDGCARDTAIVSHAAYAYLLAPRGLEQEGISGAGGHGDASPQRLAALSDRIREEGIPAVLAEPLEGRADAEALARESGVDLLEIDPLEVGTDDLLAQGYPDALRAQAQAFAEALECG
jgi:zinc transport system substrate-binding protein